MSSVFRGNTSEKAERRQIMGKKKEKPIDLKNLEPEEKLKYEVAEELGLLDNCGRAEQHPVTSLQSGASLIQLYNWGDAMGDGNGREDKHI